MLYEWLTFDNLFWLTKAFLFIYFFYFLLRIVLFVFPTGVNAYTQIKTTSNSLNIVLTPIILQINNSFTLTTRNWNIIPNFAVYTLTFSRECSFLTLIIILWILQVAQQCVVSKCQTNDEKPRYRKWDTIYLRNDY